jgi:catechol-2,3-dioxygenase
MSAALCASMTSAEGQGASQNLQTTKIKQVVGVGINVSDLGRSLKFYTEVIGLKIHMKIPATGDPKEIALSLSGTFEPGIIVLAKSDAPATNGNRDFGRIITNAKSAQLKEVVARATAAGYKSRWVGQGEHEVFITDPDGYALEIYADDSG